ncbi:MAG TPA: M20/M25/M40 family metallo-hydrolase [Blastocatellia bacterium]|nr:M20/M25/M40 family metallo-hydrolase [Blastocatellia bacterium]
MKRVALAALIVVTLMVTHSWWRVEAQDRSVRAYRQAHEAEIIDEFAELLRLPNVAADTANIRRNAARLLEMMQRRGITARLLEGNGPPAVFGEIKTPGATRTVAIYAHYDGQPVDPARWATPPFTPTLRDQAIEANGQVIPFRKRGESYNPEWRLYARSASDDKAPIMAMLAALDALKAANRQPSVNLKFFFDGEEEAGSPNLADIVTRNAALLGADVWLCADGPVHQTRKPLLYFGARGIVSATITIYGANRALHSGHYGNWSPNPAMRLAKLLASMKDDSGRVLVAGFYDDVAPLGAEEKRALAEMPATDAELMRELGLAESEGAGRQLAELINEPSLNVDGLRSEDVGRNARTVIPAEATATVDMRLVKGVDPRRQVERLMAHIRKQGYFVVETEPDQATRLQHPLIARVTTADGYRAVRTPMNLPIAQRIIQTVERALGQRPVLAPTLGGSVPLYVFEDVTHAPQIGVPTVNHDNNQHSSNENLRLQNLWDGIEIFAALMTIQ